jgi:hypothetical protein
VKRKYHEQEREPCCNLAQYHGQNSLITKIWVHMMTVSTDSSLTAAFFLIGTLILQQLILIRPELNRPT